MGTTGHHLGLSVNLSGQGYCLTSQLPVVRSATRSNEFCCEDKEMLVNKEFERYSVQNEDITCTAFLRVASE